MRCWISGESVGGLGVFSLQDLVGFIERARLKIPSLGAEVFFFFFKDSLAVKFHYGMYTLLLE